ncbi:MAG TPA: type II toxin-antitoxin system RelE/ParE family toxin [Gemmataceae bacterium]|nr:type II toxin-antitoxin system RelE/ParE family toxin [Gemmataceae bacterium]
MAAKLIIAEEAEGDLDEAYAWYERQRPGLGEDFLRCVDACLQSTRRNPKMHPVVFKQYRRALVRRYPYAVFFEYANRAMTVYGVFHTSRDPNHWRTRLS